ncbi:MAG: outer membrane protein [Alphaproteobacteria bacterium]
MTKLLFSSSLTAVSIYIGTIAFLPSAIGADLPVALQQPEPELPYEETFSDFPWDRYYVGLAAGYGESSMETTDTFAPVSFFDNSFDMSGGLVGVTVGRNFQMYDNWVFGIEFDAALADIDGGKSGTSGEYIEAELNGILTARARLGYAFGDEKQFLPFVTAGLAAGHYEVGSFGGVSADPDDPVGNAVEESDWLGGYTLGAGLEYLVSHGVSIKADYLFMRFDGSITTDPIIPQGTVFLWPTEYDPDDVHVWRLGVNVAY